MGLIKGIHHVSFKCTNQQEYDKTIVFYRDVLEIPVARTWDTGIMFNTGSGIIEIFNNGDTSFEKGVINHFALATDDVDACVKAVSDAGYEVFIQPGNVTIQSDPSFPIRMAFCHGPLGEEIEFFQEL